MKPSDIKVIRKKLSKDRGYWYPKKVREPYIEIDSRLKGQEELEIFIHEFTHHIQPYLDEEVVEKIGNEMGEFLYKQGYRKTNSNG
jgi:hypothetical protein